MRLKVKSILPKNWKFKEKKKSILIWYENPNKNPAPLLLNKTIEVSEDLGILMGFWAGDGGKIQFSLSNNNLEVLKKVYDILLKNFGNIELKVRLSIPINLENRKKSVIKKVRTVFPKLDISVDQFKQKRNGCNIKLCNYKVITIKFVKLLFDYLAKNVDLKNFYWSGYLKGIIAAEGYMDLRQRYKTLSRISIAQTNKIFRRLIMKSLKARGISYSCDEEYIKIFGKNNYDIIFLRKIFSLHPLKKKQFLLGYNNIKQEQYEDGVTDLLILKVLKRPNRVSIVASKTGRCRQTIREHMQLKQNSLKKQGLIKVLKDYRGSVGELWGLTNKGLNHLDKVVKAK